MTTRDLDKLKDDLEGIFELRDYFQKEESVQCSEVAAYLVSSGKTKETNMFGQ
jgi:hypothetical protein